MSRKHETIKNKYIMNIETISEMINRNYSVENTFDDHYDGTLARYKTKKEAETVLENRGKRRKGYLTGCTIVHNQAIIGEVDFNGRSAYVFNFFYQHQRTNDTIEQITAGSFDQLKQCYVFTSMLFSSKELKRLIDEYHDRGGCKFEKYHDYENKIINPVRAIEQQAFRNEIVEHILKHGYQETKKLTWSNGKITIKQVSSNCISLGQPQVKTLMDLDDVACKIEINSIFGNYYSEVNRLSADVISIPCKSKVNTRSFAVFTITCQFKK